MLSKTGRLASVGRLAYLPTHRAGSSFLPTKRVIAFSTDLAALEQSCAGLPQSSLISIVRRFYAGEAVSRPKAHTGRPKGSTKKKTTATAAKTATGAKKATTKAKPKTKAKTKAKAKPKKKTKAKKNAKAKAKKPRKVLTDAQKETRAKRKAAKETTELKKKALLKEPKKLPATAYLVFNTERARTALKGHTGDIGEVAKESGRQFKAFSPEQLEHYNHIANQNKATNAAEYRKWITSFTPTEIYEANLARAALRRRQAKKGSSKYSSLKDERQVRRPLSGYILFATDRHASGDLKGVSIGDRAKLVSKEWKELSASAKQQYLDNAVADTERYRQEKKTVYAS